MGLFLDFTPFPVAGGTIFAAGVVRKRMVPCIMIDNDRCVRGRWENGGNASPVHL
jgi:hypothetical protein